MIKICWLLYKNFEKPDFDRIENRYIDMSANRGIGKVMRVNPAGILWGQATFAAGIWLAMPQKVRNGENFFHPVQPLGDWIVISQIPIGGNAKSQN